MSIEQVERRDIWKCQNKDPNDWTHKCEQEIYKNREGLVVNLKDGIGGLAGKRHICPFRVGSAQHHTGPKDGNWKRYWYEWEEKQKKLPCGLCGEKFNSLRMPVCPNCYKQECRKCHAQQQWISGEGIELNKCRSCGHDRLDVIETFYYRKKLSGNFETAKDMMPK